MSKTHLMVDLETLSTMPNATVASIGAVRFDPFANELETPEFEKLYLKLDYDSQDKLGTHISDSTIEWWAKQSPEALVEVFEGLDRVSVEEALKQLYKFSFGCTTFWAHGAMFDIVILENLFRKVERGTPWKYYQVRCSRVLFDLGIDPDRPEITAHNALDDAVAQAISVQSISRKLKELGLNPYEKLDK